jgi:glycosyltransferase involved in cell wall biosynthesis
MAPEDRAVMCGIDKEASSGPDRLDDTNPSPTIPVHTLYICYFGLREPLVQTQVLPYLRQLVSGGLQVSLLTFEPRLRQTWSSQEITQHRAALKSEGIGWTCLTYHKWPSLPATLYDIARGTLAIIQLMRRENVTVLHARNHVPALMGALAKKVKGGRLVFDIRGFMPEEYTDAGVWPENGYLYHGLKRVERYLLRASDAFVVLTEKARVIVFPGCTDTDSSGRPVEVIPCCVDFERFETPDMASRESLRREFKVEHRRVIVYVGSFGGWYMTDQMTEFLAVAHEQDPDTFSVILTQSPQQIVSDRMCELGINPKDFLVARVSPEEVPRYLRMADIAISFIKPCYSKQSSSPTKIAEYLASGLPVVCNVGVGDLDKLIQENQVGVLLREFTPAAYLEALDQIDVLRRDERFSDHAREVARREFDLAGVGRTRYRRLYQRLLKSTGSFSASSAAAQAIPSNLE